MSTAFPGDPASSVEADHRLSLTQIELAATLIDRPFLQSPQSECAALSARLGCELILKDETANPIGCFKGRGAEFFAAQFLARGERAPLVCASAGNFGLGLAHACSRRGLELTVFVAETANPVKVEGIRRYGAHIISAGRDFDAAKQAARLHAHVRGLRFVEDGAEPEISEGAGSIAIELLAGGDYDAILVPLGNGALLAGMARWVKAHSPATEMIGVCSAGAPVMVECWRHGVGAATIAEAKADTIADGIAVRVPVPAAVNDLRTLVDDMLLVDDAQLIVAMRLLHSDAGLMCEPSAAAGVAAIAAHRERFAARRVATVLTGRNLTQTQIEAWFH
ncbi:MAG: threonine ammonia-lyase [Steroidobacter sp.]